ncbi:sensor histidine kinase [Flindersiella endophytica]
MNSVQTVARERSFRERSQRWWHVAYVVFMLVIAAAWAVGPDIPPTQRWIGLGLLAVMVAAYATVGRRLLMGAMDASAEKIGYLLLVCVCTLVLIQMQAFSHFLLFIAFSHIWSMLPFRWSAGFAFGLSGALVVLSLVFGDRTLSAILTSLIVYGITTALGFLLGMWITGVIGESEQRQALIDELEQTRAELAESHHREGVLAERERLATEIHDTLAQGFMSILMLSQAPETPDRMERIERTARENLAEARSLIEALGPDDLRSGTLADACRRVVERLEVRGEFRLHGEPRTLPANAEVVLLRATQEALTNVRKHARASLVEVTLTYGDDQTSVEVSDDGVGFDVDAAEGFGLRGMRNRVRQVEGRLEVTSRPGQGTSVKVVVP